VKSAEFESVSVQPFSRRMAAVVLVSDAAAAGPSKQLGVVPPKPTKSTTMSVSNGHPVPANVGELVSPSRGLTRATLPAVADMAMLPAASGVGRLIAVVLVPAASCTR